MMDHAHLEDDSFEHLGEEISEDLEDSNPGLFYAGLKRALEHTPPLRSANRGLSPNP